MEKREKGKGKNNKQLPCTPPTASVLHTYCERVRSRLRTSVASLRENRRSSCAKHATHPAEIYNGRKSERVAYGEVKGEVAAKVGMDDGEMVALALVNGVDGLHAAVEAEDEEAQVQTQP